MKQLQELSGTTINERGDLQESALPPSGSMQYFLFQQNKIQGFQVQFRKYRSSSSSFIYTSGFSQEPKRESPIDAQKVSEFYFYKEKWKKETAALSSPASIRMNRNYQKIIGLGNSIIPLILAELERQPDDWFYALEMLTKDEENPTTEEMGFTESVKAWVNWGKNKGYI